MKKIENLFEDKMPHEVKLTDTLKEMGYVFLAVICFGALCDKYLGSEEKAKEAREAGYDV